MAAEAPATRALCTFAAKLTVPRWISAIHVPDGVVPHEVASTICLQRTSGPVMPFVAGANSIGSAEISLPSAVTNASRPSVRGNDDRLLTPGATTSICAPVFENDARWLVESTAPTVSTLWYAPGYETFFEESFPEATTISTCRSLRICR